jgi:hypothetical protein
MARLSSGSRIVVRVGLAGDRTTGQLGRCGVAAYVGFGAEAVDEVWVVEFECGSFGADAG